MDLRKQAELLADSADKMGIRKVVTLEDAMMLASEYAKSQDAESGQADLLVMPKIADNKFRELAEKTYLELAEDLIQMAGIDKKKARETRLIMMKAGFDNEDLQIIPIIERALWKAYNSNFSV